MLRNLAAIEVRNAEIIDDLQPQRKAKQGKIDAINRFADLILHRAVNAEYVQRLDKHIDSNKENDVDEELSIHAAKVLGYWVIEILVYFMAQNTEGSKISQYLNN